MSAVRKFDLTPRLAPAAEVLLKVLEDDTLPDSAFRHLGRALNEVADAAEDDELGLQWAAPEQRVAVLPDRFAPKDAAPPVFDPRRCTHYVQAIYAADLEAVRTAAPDARKHQLKRSAYKLARIAGSGALPGEHVRESLAAAAVDLRPVDFVAIIDTAFEKGLANPRNLPAEEQVS
jgi:hypothetical protein